MCVTTREFGYTVTQREVWPSSRGQLGIIRRVPTPRWALFSQAHAAFTGAPVAFTGDHTQAAPWSLQGSARTRLRKSAALTHRHMDFFNVTLMVPSIARPPPEPAPRYACNGTPST